MTIPDTHQVSFQLDKVAFDTLKRLSAEFAAPYAAVIGKALAAMENSPPASRAASTQTRTPLVPYAYLSEPDRKSIKVLVRQWRSTGGSYAAIGKRLYVERKLCGMDNFPLGASTIRGMCAQ
jgi:hypothetical protein